MCQRISLQSLQRLLLALAHLDRLVQLCGVCEKGEESGLDKEVLEQWKLLTGLQQHDYLHGNIFVAINA